MARQGHRARSRCSRTSRASGPPGFRSAGCCSTTRGRRASGSLTFDPAHYPDPAGLIDGSPRARRPVHALGLAEDPLQPRLPARRAARRSGRPGRARPARSARSSASSRRSCGSSSRSGSTASRPTAPTRSTSKASTTRFQNVYPLLYARAVMGAFPPGTRRDLPRRDGRIAARHPRPLGGRPGRLVRRAQGGDRRRPERGDERLPDLGLRCRRLPVGGADRGGVRALGAARGRVSDHGGRRDRRERDAVDDRPERDGRAPRTRRSCTTSSSRTSTGCSRSTSRCSGRSATRTRTIRRRGGPSWEFLVGPDLLAAPVTGGGTTPSVYLPRGRLDRPLHRHARDRRRGLHPHDAAHPVPVLRPERRGRAVQPADRRLVVGSRRADPSGRARAGSRRTSPPSTCAASRATSRSSFPRPSARCTSARRQEGSLDLACGTDAGSRRAHPRADRPG